MEDRKSMDDVNIHYEELYQNHNNRQDRFKSPIERGRKGGQRINKN